MSDILMSDLVVILLKRLSLELGKPLRILKGKKHRQTKLQQLQKVRIWPFRLLVHHINYLQEVLKLKQNFQKNKVVAGKTPFFVIVPFCSQHTVCLNIGF